ncbi:MAG: hypothetical protein IKR30_02760 [Bacteroidales bacterium]|nr:hypothetical protein [Bacteroidales bacterium]
MARKKKYLYDVTVEDYSMMDTFYNIPADTYQEAAQIAKKRFVRRYWNRKLLKAHMETKSDNLW